MQQTNDQKECFIFASYIFKIQPTEKELALRKDKDKVERIEKNWPWILTKIFSLYYHIDWKSVYEIFFDLDHYQILYIIYRVVMKYNYTYFTKSIKYAFRSIHANKDLACYRVWANKYRRNIAEIVVASNGSTLLLSYTSMEYVILLFSRMNTGLPIQMKKQIVTLSMACSFIRELNTEDEIKKKLVALICFFRIWEMTYKKNDVAYIRNCAKEYLQIDRVDTDTFLQINEIMQKNIKIVENFYHSNVANILVDLNQYVIYSESIAGKCIALKNSLEFIEKIGEDYSIFLSV